MKNSYKDVSLKDKLKQALSSTIRVISDDLITTNKNSKNKKTKKLDSFELEKLDNEIDFIKARADADSSALKKKFSDEKIYKKNLPNNASCKLLYSIAEKIRYESIGTKMLKGIKTNLRNNYNQVLNLKRKDRLKSKDDVTISEAFELYMLKNFHDIELNPLTNKMLSFWEKDFNKSIGVHLISLKENLESQDKFSSKFLKILQEMDIFQDEENEEIKEENQDDGQDNPSNDEEESKNDDKKDPNSEEETQSKLDTKYDIDEYKLDEQLIDSDTDKQNNENIIQKKIGEFNLEYKIFTDQYDEIIKAENLENFD